MLRAAILFVPRSRRTLNQLACLYRSDKGTHWFWKHGYTLVYEQVLGPLRSAPICLLEIGLRHDPFYRVRSRRRSSLSIWRDYFPEATVVGFDVNDFHRIESGRVMFVQGDQSRPADLLKVVRRVGPLDVVIDDGSHASYDQWTALTTLFPHLRPGGLYCIEDLDYQPPDVEAVRPPTPRLVELLRQAGSLAQLGIDAEDVSFACNDALAIIRKLRPPR